VAWKLGSGIAGATVLAAFAITPVRAQRMLPSLTTFGQRGRLMIGKAYTKLVPPSQGKLFVVASAGGTTRLFLDDSFSYGEPAWSPYGGRIAFTSNSSGSFQIWTASQDSADLKQVTSAGDYNVQPCWSPDGKQIAFVSYPSQRIFLVPAAGGQSPWPAVLTLLFRLMAIIWPFLLKASNRAIQRPPYL
jgi:Tol biopolymer transport system component